MKRYRSQKLRTFGPIPPTACGRGPLPFTMPWAATGVRLGRPPALRRIKKDRLFSRSFLLFDSELLHENNAALGGAVEEVDSVVNGDVVSVEAIAVDEEVLNILSALLGETVVEAGGTSAAVS